MLQKLETMEIVQLLGGMGLILAAVLTGFYRIFILKVKSTWDKRTSKEIEQLRQELTRSNTTLNNLQSNYLTQVQAVSTKRLEAIEQLWKACMVIRESIPTPVFMILSILPEQYVTMDYLNTPNPKGIELGKELGKLDLRSVSPVLDASKPIEQLRPFIHRDLYTLYKTYTGLIGGAVLNTITKYEMGTITHWKNEESMKKLLLGVLTEKELNHIYGLTFESFKTLLDLMELKIIECINRNTVGSGTTSNSLEELQKLEAIFKIQHGK